MFVKKRLDRILVCSDTLIPGCSLLHQGESGVNKARSISDFLLYKNGSLLKKFEKFLMKILSLILNTQHVLKCCSLNTQFIKNHKSNVITSMIFLNNLQIRKKLTFVNLKLLIFTSNSKVFFSIRSKFIILFSPFT